MRQIIYFAFGASVLALPICSFAIPVILPDSQTQALSQALIDTGILRAQVEQMRTFQESVLNLAWWALTVVATVAIALVSFSWWNNGRNYEREKASMQQEIENHFEKRLLEFENRISQRLSDFEVASADRTSNISQRIDARLTARIEELLRLNKAEFSKIAQEKNTQQEQLNKNLETIRFDLLHLRREYYSGKKSYGAKLILSVQLMQKSLLKGDFWIKRSMEDLSIDIEPFESKPGKAPLVLEGFSAYWIELLDSLSKVPESLKAMAEPLMVRIAALPK